MFQSIIQKIIFATTIVLCLGLISCTETNKPIDPVYNEPIVIYDTHIGKADSNMHPKISPVIVESDLILVGEFYKIVINNPDVENYVTYLINITEVLKGSTNANEVKIYSKYLTTYDKCILFLRKDGDSYVLTIQEFGGYNESILFYHEMHSKFSDNKDDIKLLLNAYNSNKELFSKVGKQDLFNLFTQLKSRSDEYMYIKSRYLMDVYYLADKQDIPMLLEWKQIENDNSTSFIIDSIIKMLEEREE
jgi:hypothetical protein